MRDVAEGHELWTGISKRMQVAAPVVRWGSCCITQRMKLMKISRLKENSQ